ncbi:lantibiotic dehydratase [Dyadobacter sp. CY345]|uniref:lantibiotic dehydratase n=1 Tax=Dyadobacter sp. CY345 TaxID=2909335 RepID=UPI001F464D44|nr:lantibiotic dehydratase [Dyadobacter sp. CY345]MCF2445429.1 lantibiotic dehydratase [Dyadobacter sp. CY345]
MIRHFGFFLLRRPALSADQLYEFHKQLSDNSSETLLKKYYLDPLAQESIFVASPALFERFQIWLNGGEISENDKLQSTLYKYFVRSSTRSTPYGLFSGCVLGAIGSDTQFQISESSHLLRNSRIDFECLIAIKEWILQQPLIQSQLKLFPNSSLYKIGQNFRYVEELLQDSQRTYFISSIEGNEYLEKIFNAATDGVTIGELTNLLVIEEIDPAEAVAFIQELVDNKILVFDLETVLTGPAFLDVLISKLASLQNTGGIVTELKNVKTALTQQSDRIAMYRQIEKDITNLISGPIKQDFIQVDTFFSYSKSQIKTIVIEQIQRSLAKLMVLNQPYLNEDLQDFKQKFSARYEDEEISLVTVLDQETGVGYGSLSALGAGYTPMIDDLIFPSAENSQTKNTAGWWQKFVLEKYTRAIKENSAIVELTDEDLSFIARHKADKIPEAHNFYAFGNLLANSSENLDEGDFTFNLVVCNGPSAVNIISRFYEGSTDLLAHLEQCAKQEQFQNPDVIFAEIIYCPDSRAGNIMARPSLYQYEIPYMGKASVETDYQIPVQDLLVSVRRGTVVLRSKRLNKRVIPRLSNAHNYKTGLPIYRFLCDLQHQDAHLNLKFDWDFLSDQNFLPQVKYQGTILNRASWVLSASEFKGISLAEVVQKLAQKRVPERFVIVSGDNELFVDRAIPFSLQLLIQAFQREKIVSIKEFLGIRENCFLEHNGRKYVSEIVIPFWNDQAAPIPGFSIQNNNEVQRRFSIGSEWLYLKIYSGEKTGEAILIRDLYPVIKQLLDENIIEKFFFIRFADPDSHLRLRFYNSHRKDFYQQVINVIENALQKNLTGEIVYKIQVDTYTRELERYGKEQIALCETLFHQDSMTILEFLHYSDIGFDEHERFLFAIKQINQLLSGADFTFAARYELLEKLKESFFNEFNGHSDLRKQLGEKYRFFRPMMETILIKDQQVTNSENRYLKQLVENVPEKTQLSAIIGSLIHMTVNRLFPSKPRAYELIIYHCLAKQYASEKSRKRFI